MTPPQASRSKARAASGPAAAGDAPVVVWLLICRAVILITIVSGGFVAGVDAGLAYNTFPLMGGRAVPEDFLLLDPWFVNLFGNVAAVRFDHRVLATLLLVLALCLRARRIGLRRGARLAHHWWRPWSRSRLASPPCFFTCRWHWTSPIRPGRWCSLHSPCGRCSNCVARQA